MNIESVLAGYADTVKLIQLHQKKMEKKKPRYWENVQWGKAWSFERFLILVRVCETWYALLRSTQPVCVI